MQGRNITEIPSGKQIFLSVGDLSLAHAGLHHVLMVKLSTFNSVHVDYFFRHRVNSTLCSLIRVSATGTCPARRASIRGVEPQLSGLSGV